MEDRKRIADLYSHSGIPCVVDVVEHGITYEMVWAYLTQGC